MSDRYGHKDYQNEVLETLRLYWRACRENGNPETAFIEVTGERHGMAHPYNKVHKLANGAEMPQDMPFVCLRVPTGGGKTVIVIKDFATHLPISVIETIAKRVRSACGCGGTVRDKRIEIQGDQAAKVRAVLEAEGFEVRGVK